MTSKSNHLGEQHWLVSMVYYWLPPLLLTLAILFLAGDWGSTHKLRFPLTILKYLFPALSGKEIYRLYLELRKVGHFMAYALLFFTYVRAWRWHLQMTRLKAILLALAVCFLVAAADESRQAFYASRTGHFRDVVLDMSGALTAAIVLFPFLRPPGQE